MRAWLLGQHKRWDPVGSLARDFRWDYHGARRADEPPLPRKFTYRIVLDYLQAQNACDAPWMRSMALTANGKN